MESTIAPPVPQRHPGRLARITTNGLGPHDSLPEELLHVWEHAVTLYHGFDWHTAAENFLFLSRAIERNLESTLCLLNASIIFARLGEYGTAAQVLEDAEPGMETTALTMFIMGHVEFELGNFDKAEECFHITLSKLDGASQRYDHLGLDFTLKVASVQQDLRVFENRNNLLGVLGTLGALPADSLFESPSKLSGKTSRSTPRTARSIDSGSVPTLDDFGTPTSVTGSPIEGYFAQDQTDKWWPQEEEIPITIQPDSILEDPESIPQYGHYRTGPKPRILPLPYDAAPWTSQKPPAQAEVVPAGGAPLPHHPFAPPLAPSGHHRQGSRTHLQPRDAKVTSGGTAQLASFLRENAPQSVLQPRNAEAFADSTQDLASFLRGPRSNLPGYLYNSAHSDDESVYSDDSSSDDRAPASEPLPKPALLRRPSEASEHLTALPAPPPPQQQQHPATTPHPRNASHGSSRLASSSHRSFSSARTESSSALRFSPFEAVGKSKLSWSGSSTTSFSTTTTSSSPITRSSSSASAAPKKSRAVLIKSAARTTPRPPPPPPQQQPSQQRQSPPRQSPPQKSSDKNKVSSQVTASPPPPPPPSADIPYSEYFPRFIAKRMSNW